MHRNWSTERVRSICTYPLWCPYTALYKVPQKKKGTELPYSRKDGRSWEIVDQKCSVFFLCFILAVYILVLNVIVDLQCLTHTHQLGIDMQLFAVAPLLVFPLWRWPRFGGVLLVALAALSTALRYHVVLSHELSSIVYFGMP